MLFLRCALYGVAVLALSACAPRIPRFMVEVDAITSPQAAQLTSYVLRVDNAPAGSTPEATSALVYDTHRVLKANGFVPAPTVKQAAIHIDFSYGISAPQTETIIHDIPIQGKTGAVASSTSTTTVSKSGKSTTNTSYEPAYGVIGYRQETELRTTYTSYAEIAAFDIEAKSAKGNPIEIWRIAMRHTSNLKDLERLVPIMLAAAAPYVGGSTGKRIQITLNEDDESILAVKGLPIPEKKGSKEEDKTKK